jgi:hypothetical protein
MLEENDKRMTMRKDQRVTKQTQEDPTPQAMRLVPSYILDLYSNLHHIS